MLTEKDIKRIDEQFKIYFPNFSKHDPYWEGIDEGYDMGCEYATEYERKRAEGLEAFLKKAIEAMERARNILTDGNPREGCNWGMLDTTVFNEVLAKYKEDAE